MSLISGTGNGSEVEDRQSRNRKLRKEARDAIQAQKRNQLLERRRFSSDDEASLRINSLSMEDVLRELGPTKFTDTKLLNRLKTILATGEDSPEEFFSVQPDTNLYTLVNVVSGGTENARAQLAAVHVLANLSPLTEKNGLKLGRSAGPYLITLLSSPCRDLKESSAIALGNLALSGYKVVKVLLNQDILERLIQTLPVSGEQCYNLDAETSKILSASLYSIYHILHTIDNGYITNSGRKLSCESLVSDEIFENLTDRCLGLLTIARNKSPLELFWVLFALSCRADKTHESVASRDTAIHTLLDVCTYEIYQKSDPRPLVKIVTPIIRLLANLCAGPRSESAILLILHHPDTVAILTALLATNYVHLCKETLWLFGNIVNSESMMVQEEIVEMDLMDKLEYHTTQAVHKLDPYAIH